jgi:hypothetical protein
LLPCCAGVLEALQGSRADLLKLRGLVAGSLGLSKQDTVVHSKAALWRLGQAIESGMDSKWSGLLKDVQLWRGVQGVSGHKMTPLQLQELYRTMKRQGYQSPATEGANPLQPPRECCVHAPCYAAFTAVLACECLARALLCIHPAGALSGVQWARLDCASCADAEASHWRLLFDFVCVTASWSWCGTFQLQPETNAVNGKRSW